MNRPKINWKSYLGSAVLSLIVVSGYILLNQSFTSQLSSQILNSILPWGETTKIEVRFDNGLDFSYDLTKAVVNEDGLKLKNRGDSAEIITLDKQKIPENNQIVAFEEHSIKKIKESITYQFSADDKYWYYFDGDDWAKVSSGCDNNCSNSAVEVSNHITDLPIESNEILIKAILNSTNDDPILKAVKLVLKGVRESSSPAEEIALYNFRSSFVKDQRLVASLIDEPILDKDLGEWDRSSLEISGQCRQDGMAVFTITNTGTPGDGDMDGTTIYRVYRNDVLEDSQSFQLNGAQSFEVVVFGGGDTIRLEADQRPDHPGSSTPSYTVYGCGDPGACGNGILEAPEECDDGNTDDHDGCSSTCEIETPACGNGILEAGEACDDGNLIDGDGCSSSCEIEQISFCGDGNLDIGEECDDGNNSDGDGCSATCELEQNYCPQELIDFLYPKTKGKVKYWCFTFADGWSDCGYADSNNADIHGMTVHISCSADYDEFGYPSKEEPDQNLGQPAVSSYSVWQYELKDTGMCYKTLKCGETILPFCGDGNLDPGEQCDDGNNTNGDGCSDTCEIEEPPICGDGNLDPGEQCDDGNNTNGDGCDEFCEFEQAPECGNGILEPPDEDCDDGNLIDGDGCSSTCTIEGDIPICHGTGSQTHPFNILFVDQSAIDGIGANDHTLHPTDIIPATDVNGDNIIDEADCVPDVDDCGNGVLDPGEQCDDGNNIDGDGCSAICEVEQEPACGNGILEAPEQCDDGNLIDEDGCSSTCEIEGPVCGNGNLEPPEQCDDGNVIDGDGCSAICEIEYDIPICHSTGSQSNPFNIILVDTSARDGTGADHSGHLDDIIPATDTNGDNIIDESDCVPDKLPPIALDDAAQTPVNTPVDIDILDNDDDPDGNIEPGTVTILSGPSDGTLGTPDPITGIITYTPDTDFIGLDTFDYEVCDNDGLCDTATVIIAVGDVLIPPVANDDDASTGINTPVSIPILSNDTDLDGTIDPTSVTLLSLPTIGTVVVNPTTGVNEYTPFDGVTGTDTYSYEVCDNDRLCDTAIVTVTITGGGRRKHPPIAGDDTALTDENTPVAIDIVANDSDPDFGLDWNTIVVISGPSNGSVTTIDYNTGVVIYTPNAGFLGIDQFDYRICDIDNLCDTATVTIGIGAILPPIATDDAVTTDLDTPVVIDLLINDFDLDGVLDASSTKVLGGPGNGSVIIDPSNGFATYTPDTGFVGIDNFTYEVCDDDSLCDNAFVTIEIVSFLLPPVAENDSEFTVANMPVDINMLVNDSDPDGTLVSSTATVTRPPSNGTVTIDPATGIATYLPDIDFVGVDTYDYQVCDNDGLCADATVTIDVISIFFGAADEPEPTALFFAAPEPILGCVIFGANEFILYAQQTPLSLEGTVQFVVNEAQTFYLETKEGTTWARINNLDTGETYRLSYDEDLKLWVGTLIFDKVGFYRLEGVIGNNHCTYDREINSALVSEKAAIVDANSGDAIDDAIISVFEKDPNTGNFQAWNGVAYGQYNPILIKHGQFSIILPTGEFYFVVQSPGYRTIQSLITRVNTTSLVTAEIEMAPNKSFFQNLFSTFRRGSDNFPLTITGLPEMELIPIGTTLKDVLVEREDGMVGKIFEVLNQTKPIILFIYSNWNTLAQEQIEIYTKVADVLGDNYQFAAISTMEPNSINTSQITRGNYDLTFLKPVDDQFYEDYMIISLPHFFIMNEDNELLETIVGSRSEEEIVEIILNTLL